ncbi:hypothetical protein BDQ17DRAFT_1431169 [Cyathus striatus]|nr:hypothetical protein BDQ17DRAFT_1431169 [Cyathus striatus]
MEGGMTSCTLYCSCPACAFAVSKEHNVIVAKDSGSSSPRYLPLTCTATTQRHVLGGRIAPQDKVMGHGHHKQCVTGNPDKHHSQFPIASSKLTFNSE